MTDKDCIYTTKHAMIYKDGKHIGNIEGDETTCSEDIENAERIVNCLTACRGISDPIDLVTRNNKLIDLLEPFAKMHCNDPDCRCHNCNARYYIDKIKEEEC